jgi:hypothetical protein
MGNQRVHKRTRSDKHCLLAAFLVLSLLVVQDLVAAAQFIQRGRPYYVVHDPKAEYESFFLLTDSVLRREIGSFSFAGSLLGYQGGAELEQFEVLELDAQRVEFVDPNGGELRVVIQTGRFDPGKHRLEYFGRTGFLIRIDGRPFWGIDGRIPTRTLESVRLISGLALKSLPDHAIRDVFEPNLCRRSLVRGRLSCQAMVFRSEDGRRLYIHMFNGRIPSLYEVTWIIRDGRYSGRVAGYAY